MRVSQFKENSKISSEFCIFQLVMGVRGEGGFRYDNLSPALL